VTLACMTRVWEHSRQKGSARVLVLALADIGDDNGFAYPGLDWLAKRTYMSRRQTQRLLDQLEADGEITMRQKVTGRGNRPEYLVLTGLDAKHIARNLIRYFDLSEAEATEKSDILSKRASSCQTGKSRKKGVKLSAKGDISGKKGRHVHAQKGDTPITPDSNTPSESVLGGSESALVDAITKVTGCDPLLNQTQISDLAQDLLKANYTDQDVLRWHQDFWLNDWRSKGGLPSLKEVRQFIRKVQAQPVEQAQGEDPYFASDYFKDRNLEEPTVGLEPTVPERRPYAGPWVTWWNAALGQFQIQLNRATYDTWLRHLVLIDVVEREDAILEFVAEVPHKYAKDWIEQHLMVSFERNLFDIARLGEGAGRRKLPSGRVGQGVKITISTKGN